MKDYTFYDDRMNDNSDFVLDFNKDGDKITVFLADGTVYSVPNNDENERLLLEKLYSQLRSNKRIDNNAKKSIVRSSIVGTVMCAAVAGNAIILSTGISAAPAVSWIAIGLGSLFAIGHIANIKRAVSVRKDIAKNVLLINDEKFINGYIREENIQRNLREEVVSQINATPQDKPVFDLNTVKNVSLEELRAISNNIHRYLSFGFTEEESKEEEISRTLKPSK